ncbi:hypothetical protein AAG906_000061 [Vitis piasezkii]
MDVKNIFLNGILNEEVYVEQPKGFQDPRGGVDQTLFIRRNDEVFLVAQIYIDDIVFGFASSECALDFANEMKSEFEMSMVGELTYFLGFQVKQLKDGIFLSQSKEKVEETLYRSMIGSLLYLTASKPDIAFSIGVCAKYQACPKESHLIALKRIIMKNTSDGCFYIGNCLVAWMNQGTMVVLCDNTSAINISKNPILHSRTKHIDIRHHFIRDLVEDKVVSLEYVPTEGQIADILTKPLDVSKFESLRKSIGLCTIS